jgi:glutathione S-transferase
MGDPDQPNVAAGETQPIDGLVLWQLRSSHYNEKVRWALDYKRVPHVRRSLVLGAHVFIARRLTGDTSTTPHLRRVIYHELLPYPRCLVPLMADGQPPPTRMLLRAAFPVLRAATRRRLEITAQTAQVSRAKTVAAMDRLEREIGASGHLVGEAFTVADLTAAALFNRAIGPPEFPYRKLTDSPDSLRQFFTALAERPGGRWVADTYRRYRRSEPAPS